MNKNKTSESFIQSKDNELIDINVNVSYRALTDSDIINILCMAFNISDENKKYYHEELDLIKNIAPDDIEDRWVNDEKDVVEQPND